MELGSRHRWLYISFTPTWKSYRTFESLIQLIEQFFVIWVCIVHCKTSLAPAQEMPVYPLIILTSQNGSTSFQNAPRVYSIFSVENCWSGGFSNQLSHYDSLTAMLSVRDILNPPLADTVLSSWSRNKTTLTWEKKKLMRRILEQLTQ